jgi:plasmid stabilization system protein ParE
MDPDVLALVREAERDLRRLLVDLDEQAGWEAQAHCLLTLQTIAATLVDASRRHAEDLSRRAGQRRAGDPGALP